jgi:hypothetical protein
MRIHWKIVGKIMPVLALLSLLCSGCGGFSGSKSFSPASFFMPGLLKADPQPPQESPAPQPEFTNNFVAQLR